jgi:hypothetical protein
MATVDASIPLQVQQPKSPMQTMGEALQMGQQIHNFRGQQAMREAFANADTSTPEGQQDLIKRVGAVNPQEAMTLQSQFTKQREAESTISKNNAQASRADLETGIMAMGKIEEVGSAAYQDYLSALHNLQQQGMPFAQADAQARGMVSQLMPQIKAHLKSLKNGAGNPLFNADQIDAIPDQFDPEKTLATVHDAKQRALILQQQHQYATEDQTSKRDANTARHQRVEEEQRNQQIGIDRSRLGETERHNRADEANAGARLGIERERLDGDPGAIESNAQLIAAGKLPPPTGAALRNPAMARIMQRVQEINPNYDAKTYQSQLKGEKEFTSGKLGQTVRSLNVATDHLDALDSMGKQLKNGDMRAFNSIAQRIAAETGNPAPTNFDAAKKIVADEVVKAIVGSGGGVSDREEAARAFDKASSPEQLSGAIATAKRLMRGQLHGLKQQYKASTGKDDFDTRFLSGEAKGIEGGGGAAKPAAAGGDFSHLWN